MGDIVKLSDADGYMNKEKIDELKAAFIRIQKLEENKIDLEHYLAEIKKDENQEAPSRYFELMRKLKETDKELDELYKKAGLDRSAHGDFSDLITDPF